MYHRGKPGYAEEGDWAQHRADKCWSSEGEAGQTVLYSAIPEQDVWRGTYLAKLLTWRGEAYYKSEEEEVLRLSELIDSLCIN